MYLNNLYPVPSLKLLEKRKRKWYKDNVDKDFDINYDPDANGNQNNDNQQQRRAGPAPGANPYVYAYQQAAHEAIPSLKPIVALLYVMFWLTLPFQGITNKILFAAWLTGLVYKQGFPKFSLDYLRAVIPDDHFQNLGYMAVVMFLGGGSIIIYSPIIVFIFIFASEVGIETLNKNPNTPILSFFKDYMQKGVTGKNNFLSLKSDLEIYIGIYLVVGWFLGWSNIISIFFYWQYMRLKYMLNYSTQLSFRTMSSKIDGFVLGPNVPSIIQTIWSKFKDLCAWMVQFDQPGAGRPSMCTIF